MVILNKNSRILYALNTKKSTEMKKIYRNVDLTDSPLHKTILKFINLELIEKVRWGRYILTDKGAEISKHIMEIDMITRQKNNS